MINLNIITRDNYYYEKIGNNKPKKLENLPFNIPNNWIWVKLNNISNVISGYSFKSSKYTSSGIRIIRISDFDSKEVDNNEPIFYEYNEKFNSYKIENNDIILAMTGGTVGKNIIIKKANDYYLNQRVARIRTFNVNYNYIYYLINTTYIQGLINDSKNSTNDNISLKDINNLLIPLPPLDEQQRIVDKINLLEFFIKQYDEIEQKLSKLENEFPEKLKKSVLQYAMQGKLIKQDPNDDSIKDLLKQIHKEKQKLYKEGKLKKKDLEESIIYKSDDKSYY